MATAPAKINLALRVGSRRADGYHPLNSLFHAVDLSERVSVGAAASDGDELTVTGRQARGVPLGRTNLALMAAALLRREHGALPPVRLQIDKAIPVAGGLAGGSADAAAALRALNDWWGLGLSRERLIELAAELGSDVPFAVLGGNAIGQGRGEDLRPVPSRGSLHWALVISPEGMSTPEVFAHFDRRGHASGLDGPPPIPPALLEGLAQGDPALVGANLVNDLQPVAFALRPELSRVAQAARDAGALGAIVSGSGPTVACLAANGAHAQDLAAAMRSWLAQADPAAMATTAANRVLVAQGPAEP
jgi:4-diphosphocytidyl-2-C-methyl-D-erythritol kinase